MRLLLTTLLLLGTAEAGRRNRGSEDAEVVAPPPAPTVPAYEGAFDVPLPWAVGEVPTGLANLSAQGCAACHPTTHSAWALGHGAGPSEALLAAADDAANPACTSCHRPLAAQQAQAFPFAFGPDRSTPTRREGPLDLTLAAEGVTCAACHVREGIVLGTRTGPVAAPHGTRPAPELGDGRACASCHQLEVGGTAVYDTVGEWARSPHAAAGIGCLDCHGAGGPDGRVPDQHAGGTDLVGVSLQVRASGLGLVRGGEAPLVVDLRLQNTGAGHAWPSTGPWSGARLQASLRTTDDDGVAIDAAQWSIDLARRFDEAWSLLEDTRLPAGGQAAWTWEARLPQDAPPGPYRLHVALVRTARGEPVGEPVLIRVVPLQVD